MTAEEHAQSLESLAGILGVTRSYHDGTGRFRRASDDALLAVVRALGAPLERLEDATDALRAARAEAALPHRACVVTLTHAEGGTVEVACEAPRRVAAWIVLDSAETFAARITPSPDGGARVHIPQHTPIGCHHLEIDDGAGVRRVHLLVAPSRLPEVAHGWCLFAPLYALRFAARPGLATYGDLARLGGWMTEGFPRSHRHRDAALLGTLPLLACFFEEPFEPSPYSPISRAFWSELYVDPTASAEHSADAQALRGLEAPARHGDRQAARIDYRGAMRERRRQIEALLRTLDSGTGPRRDAFERALEEDDELARYAAFRAAVERHGTTWEKWPARARAGTLRAGVDYDGEAFRYHAYAQWLAREQVADAAERSPAGLYLDLPLGSHGGGYDTWRYADDFASGVAVGAPPDAVFDGGQNWGFPPMHPGRARAGGYACLRAALGHHFSHAALLRVDHVMGLHRTFWIPDGFTAADGVYVRSAHDELWSILSIEAARARGGRGAGVVGEDLGTVPDEVRAEMNNRGALRMHVVPFEGRDDPAAPLVPSPRDALACLGTHDMEPFAAWWDEPATKRHDIARFLGCDAEPQAALAALLAWLSAGDATVVCANLEDLWLERERQNMPGAAAGDDNWQRPFSRTFESFACDPQVRRLLDTLRGTTARTAEPS